MFRAAPDIGHGPWGGHRLRLWSPLGSADVPDRLPADQVLVTVGTPCTMSAIGSTATALALMQGAPEAVALSAFDAGLVELAVDDGGSIRAAWPDGTPASFEQIEIRHGARLAAERGIRVVSELVERGASVDVAAALPHDLGNGGLRRLAGITYDDVRGSGLRDMHGLFSDDAGLGPSVQAQLFAFAGLGALAALPRPLSEIVDEPIEFRVVAAAAFAGLDAWAAINSPGGPVTRDKFAARLAGSLLSHGSALMSTMLAPSYPLGRATKNPDLLQSLRSPTGFMRVPQSPMNSVGACASSLISLADVAPQMLLRHAGFRPPRLILWTAADSPTLPAWEVLEGFGPGALVTTDKLTALNAGRARDDRRGVADSLTPFDVDACGTVIGDGGSGLIVTTLDVALRHRLDITSIIVGWGQSGETGGKAHFAGVGFGGENALIQAFKIAREAHGYGVSDFGYLAAHATGTRTNSRTDLTSVATARTIAAEHGGGAVRAMRVGTPKALGDGHTMGDAGLKEVAHALRYVLGETSVGLPTLRRIDPDLGDVLEQYDLRGATVPGDADGGAICATQGFGGYDGAVALRAANPDSIARYACDPADLASYLEQWREIRGARERRELVSRTTRGEALRLALEHRWRGAD
jgi:3-oxoacyl-[acyl-carrier-protein] synthase II